MNKLQLYSYARLTKSAKKKHLTNYSYKPPEINTVLKHLQ